jgi:hypothetical protein
MQLDLLDNGWMDMSCSTIILYSLCSMKHVAEMDVSGHILVSRTLDTSILSTCFMERREYHIDSP